MSDALTSKAFLDLFLWWAGEFDAAERFYATWSHLPASVAPDDYDWTNATEAAERLLNHVPSNAPEALCLIEVLIDHLDDREELTSALRALQGYIGQRVLGELVGKAPHPVVIDYASRAA